MTLLSVLRNGGHHFLPLLLSKVHDVLPRLVNPMLQTVPDTPCAEVNTFDGFGNAGMGIASGVGMNGGDFKSINNGAMTSEFKMPLPSQGLSQSLSPFDKRIESLSTPTTESQQSNDNSPFSSPSVIQNPMEYPGLAEYGGFPNLSGPSMDHSSNIGNSNIDFKPNLGVTRQSRPPLSQGCGGSSFNIGGMPRSVPDYGNQHLQRANSDGVDMGMATHLHRGNSDGVDMGMGGVDLPFR